MQTNKNKSCDTNGCKHGKMVMSIIILATLAGGYFLFAGKNTDNEMGSKQQMKEKALTMEKDSKMMKDDMAKKDVATTDAVVGSYEIYDASKIARAKTGKVILFFRASWCLSCKSLDKDIREHVKDIPENVTILDVDYDAHADLKKQYGVVMQHTLVQVDDQGKELQKWTGVPTLADLTSELKK